MQFQLASKGLGLGARSAPSHLTPSARSLHVHVHVPRAGAPVPPAPAHANSIPGRTAANTAGRILQTTRTALTRFFTHLTTPGLSHPVAAGRSLSTVVNASVRPPTIQQGLSLPVRHALSQPKAPFLPRASPVSRSTVHVGLSTARNFSSARPIFQHLVQNVPVAGRAIYEADWDLERKMMKDKMKRDLSTDKEKENIAGSKSLLKPTSTKMTVSSVADELEHYFPAPAPVVSGVSTILLIPLALSPTSRLPLSTAPNSSSGTTEPHLLVFSDIQEVLSSHHTHSLRVSSLFTRLDTARVWEKGAAFTAHGDASGLCTVLRVEFKGWTEAMVRGVIGEGGKGWCRVVEVREDEDESDAESGMSSMLSSRLSSQGRSTREFGQGTPPEIDPSASFILPTLDFSSSFLAASESHYASPPISFPPSPALSTSDLHSKSWRSSSASSRFSSPPFSELDLDLDAELSDGDQFSDGSGSESWADAVSVAPSSGSVSLIGFSSDFLARTQGELVECGSREDMFL